MIVDLEAIKERWRFQDDRSSRSLASDNDVREARSQLMNYDLPNIITELEQWRESAGYGKRLASYMDETITALEALIKDGELSAAYLENMATRGNGQRSTARNLAQAFGISSGIAKKVLLALKTTQHDSIALDNK